MAQLMAKKLRPSQWLLLLHIQMTRDQIIHQKKKKKEYTKNYEEESESLGDGLGVEC